MMAFLGELDFADPGVNEFTEYYNKYIGFDLEGGKMGPVIHDEPSGNLIFNVGLASGDEDVISVTVNIRYPVTCTDEQVYEVFEKTLEGTEVGFVKKMLEKPVYLPDDDPMVQNLIGAYVDETGDDKTNPLVMGGGTYAKLIPGTLAYGGCSLETRTGCTRLQRDCFLITSTSPQGSMQEPSTRSAASNNGEMNVCSSVLDEHIRM